MSAMPARWQTPPAEQVRRRSQRGSLSRQGAPASEPRGRQVPIGAPMVAATQTSGSPPAGASQRLRRPVGSHMPPIATPGSSVMLSSNMPWSMVTLPVPGG